MPKSPAANLARITPAALCIALCMTHATPAFSDVGDIEAANNQIGAHIRSDNMNYTETVNDADTGNPKTLDSEGGRVTGYGLSASAMKNLWLGRDYIKAQYSSSYGTTDYTGGTQVKPAYGSVVGTSGARISDGSIRYGRGLSMDDESLATLYGELGRHKYIRTLGYGTPTGYQETYTHNYYGIGALLQYSPFHQFVCSFNALLGRTYGANIVTALPAPYVGYSAKLGNSTLHKLGLSADYAATKSLHINAGVELVGWSYGASTSQPIGNGLYAYEPNSTTSITTVSVGVGFAF